MIPLGPLNGKNMGTTISPWIITGAALQSFKTTSPPRVKEPVTYLADSGIGDLNISLQVDLTTPGEGTKSETRTMCKSNTSYMYWTLAQCVAHQSIGGCGLNTGDLLATGTVSGPGAEEHGCLMEYMKAGQTAPRRYLQDGETVTLSGYCGNGVGFGECVATLRAAREL